MANVSTSNTTDKVIISDHVTPASGSFAIYLNPKKISWAEKQPPVVEVSTGDDQSISVKFGANVLQISFIGCTFAKDGTGGNWEIFVRAKGFWSHADNNSLLYLQIMDKDSYNIA